MTMEKGRSETPKREPEQKPSALTHGVFSGRPILPGEDPREFKKLHQSLIDEWQPEGALEEETVRSIAEYVWRRNRLDIFSRVQQTKFGTDRNWESLNRIIESAKAYAGRPKQFRKYVLQENRELQQAVFELPHLFGTDVWDSIQAFENRAEAINTVAKSLEVDTKQIVDELLSPEQLQLASLADVVTPENFEKELLIRERLEGAIDRLIKRLLHLKAGKRMMDLDSRQKALPRPNGNGRMKLRSV